MYRNNNNKLTINKMTEKQKSTAGRKSMTDPEKRRLIRLYIKGRVIDERGGDNAFRDQVYEVSERELKFKR